VAIFGEKDSHAGVFPPAARHHPAGRGELHLARNHQDARNRIRARPEQESEQEGQAETANSPLDNYTQNLNAQALAGKIDPLIGRDKELERVIQTLCRSARTTPLLVGEAGVGKTAIAEGLARRIVENNIPELLEKCTCTRSTWARCSPAPSTAAISSSAEGGAEAAGRQSARDPVHRRDPHADRRRRGLGRTLDASNLLKPALSNGS
jgi:ATP-dependent Clp protease ATP-binding subunit ClpA